MAGILSKGIKFSVAQYTSGTLGQYAEITNLQEIPSLGGSPEKVETTCLHNGNRTYIAGIKDFGELDFKFLFDNSDTTSNYRKLKSYEGEKVSVQVELPDAPTGGTETHHGTTFTFDAMLTVSLDSAAVNTALTFTCNAALQSDITAAIPA